MKKRLILLITLFFISAQLSQGSEIQSLFKLNAIRNDSKEVKSLLNSQVKYANKANFKKFISTYDKSYINADGFTYETYSNIVKDVWETYDNIKYDIKIKDIQIDGDKATVNLTESSFANIPVSKDFKGILKSSADSVYYLNKINGKWKVVSDKTLDEKTSMLYGDAIGLDIDLRAPKEVEPGYEYTASLEFTPPEGTLAIASIAKDEVEYPQGQPQEVFRRMPDDNILERLFIANKNKRNEYIIASIGLTRADICSLSIKVSLAGFGYHIIRVNVKDEESNDKKE